MTEPWSQRAVGVMGLVFVVLLIATFFGTPATPGAHAGGAKVISFYHDHKTVEVINAYLTEIAVVVGITFFWFLRERMAEAARWATLSFVGGVVLGVSGALAAGLEACLTDAVNYVSPDAMQALNVGRNDLTEFMGSIGGAIFLLAGAAAISHGNVFPRWLAWLGFVFGVAALAIPGLGSVGVGLWVLIAAILMLIQRAPAPDPAATTQ